MSQNGPIVFTATPEMAKQTNRALRSGVTYVAQQAKVAKQDDTTATKSSRKSSTKKKTTAKKKAAKKTTKKKVTKKTAAKKTKGKAKSAPKSTKRDVVKPEAVIKFVRENDGCNMTDIEQAIKAPQAKLRRVINAAREAGQITTTGQRRGLRYHIGSESAETAVAGSN